MLEKVVTSTAGNYINFSSIGPDSHGQGMCYVFNAVSKKTKAGKPFITLYLRDVQGNVVPGYIFDLASPLHAGSEMVKVINNIVCIDWQENFLRQIGLTLIIDKLSLVNNPKAEDLGRFCGAIPELQKKRDSIEQFLTDVLNVRATVPQVIETYSTLDYSQGKVGGLCQHYWQMTNLLKAMQFDGSLSEEEFRRTVSAFALYILAHSTYVRAHDAGEDDIHLVTNLTKKLSLLSEQLKIGPGALEMVNMFFGYVPRDVYVRTVVALSDSVLRMGKEFAVYRTIPLQQEGNAGYGTIRRYVVEEG